MQPVSAENLLRHVQIETNFQQLGYGEEEGPLIKFFRARKQGYGCARILGGTRACGGCESQDC